ncbi:MAG TPA: hypothetical protein VFA84_13965 [Acidimicrobiales bacterium]|nr:hypothetical protein [Acidimicrobiales bacterium]
MVDQRRARSRAAERLPEEAVGDADVATAMAEAVLEESDERQDGRGGRVEHRTSRDATPPPAG